MLTVTFPSQCSRRCSSQQLDRKNSSPSPVSVFFSASKGSISSPIFAIRPPIATIVPFTGRQSKHSSISVGKLAGLIRSPVWGSRHVPCWYAILAASCRSRRTPVACHPKVPSTTKVFCKGLDAVSDCEWLAGGISSAARRALSRLARPRAYSLEQSMY